jgi:flagellar hook-associated protein 1 FlgK
VYLGQGVDVSGIRGIVDRFLEGELVSLNGSIGYTDVESRTLGGVEDAFPTTGGLDVAMSAFFGALSDLANNPAGLTERVSLIGKAKGLADAFARTRGILTSLQKDLNDDLQNTASRVSVLTSQIARLNHQIATTETPTQPANDFRDQRQTLLQELSNLTGATVREEADGQVTVIGNGILYVSGDRFGTLDANQVNSAGTRIVTYTAPDGVGFDATALLTSGKIGATVQMRDVEVPGYIDRLDNLAYTMAQVVNQQHALGFDLSGAAGGDFFTPLASASGAASALQVDGAVQADPRLIAAAGTAAGVPGDNQNALALAALQSTTFAALGGMTLMDSFLSLAGDVGARAQVTESSLNFQKDLLTQTQSRRESVSGVNIDEEMTNLILFQRSFEASSMIIKTSDEMYQTLIDMTR